MCVLFKCCCCYGFCYCCCCYGFSTIVADVCVAAVGVVGVLVAVVLERSIVRVHESMI